MALAVDNMTELYISEHAILRAKERIGWNRTTLTRMAKQVLIRGIPSTKFRGPFAKFLKARIEKHKDTMESELEIYIHGDYMFLFSSVRLLTLWRIPKEYLKIMYHKRTKADHMHESA